MLVLVLFNACAHTVQVEYYTMDRTSNLGVAGGGIYWWPQRHQSFKKRISWESGNAPLASDSAYSMFYFSEELSLEEWKGISPAKDSTIAFMVTPRILVFVTDGGYRERYEIDGLRVGLRDGEYFRFGSKFWDHLIPQLPPEIGGCWR